MIVLPGWVWALLDVWTACRAATGMGVQHHLPLAVGAAEHPAGLIDALAMIDEFSKRNDPVPA